MGQATGVKLDWQADSRDILTDVLRDGAQRLLAEALQAEVDEYLLRYEAERTAKGQRLVVRNGYLPERTIQTGIGPVTVRQPRVDNRRAADEQERFSSRILPPYLRRTKSVEALVPWLYLKGLSTQDFPEALGALLGPEAKGLSANTVMRMKDVWVKEYADWNQRDLHGKRYVYLWVDGVYFNVRLEEESACILVVMGATAQGKKELVAVHNGVRESEQSWTEVLVELKRRGLKNGPDLAIGDGALGFWAALPKVFAKCRAQRCWVHKTMNVLNYLPKKLQPSAKEKLHQIWMAETRKDAQAAFDAFVATYQAKHPKAVECLAKDRDALLAFYDFPAEHWAHLRTTNPIESTFATVRLRTNKTKGCGTRQATLTMVFKLAQVAEKRWRKLNGHKLLEDVLRGIRFVDGIKENAA
jgi:transposase-like protein